MSARLAKQRTKPHACTMRTSTALALFLLSASSLAAAQSLPVRLQPPVFADTGAAGRADELLAAYLRKRFEALGVRMVLQLDTVTAAEVNFSVMPVAQGYDVAAVLTVLECSTRLRTGCGRGVPFDWMHYHAYRDLEEVARDLAEHVYRELGTIADMRRMVDSLARAAKH